LETVGNSQGNSADDLWIVDDGNPSSPLQIFTFSNVLGLNESFPTDWPAGNDPAQNLAVTSVPYQDTVIEDAGLYPHTASSLTLDFTGVNDKEWILTNLTISMYPTPEPPSVTLACLAGLLLLRFRPQRRWR
jgi:hypothetical protein